MRESSLISQNRPKNENHKIVCCHSSHHQYSQKSRQVILPNDWAVTKMCKHVQTRANKCKHGQTLNISTGYWLLSLLSQLLRLLSHFKDVQTRANTIYTGWILIAKFTESIQRRANACKQYREQLKIYCWVYWVNYWAYWVKLDTYKHVQTRANSITV